jgi:hypothetical protein
MAFTLDSTKGSPKKHLILHASPVKHKTAVKERKVQHKTKGQGHSKDREHETNA